METIKLGSFEFDTTRVEKSLKDLSDRLVDLQRQQRDNIERNKDLQKQYDSTAKAMQDLSNQNKQGGKEYKELSTKLSEIDKEQKSVADGQRKLQDATARVRDEYKLTAKVQNSLRDSLGNVQTATEAYQNALNREIKTKSEAKANNSELIKLTDQLNLKKKDAIPLSKEETEALAKLNAKIDQNTAFLKDNHSEMQKQQANIGNYKNQIVEALKSLATGGTGASVAFKAMGAAIGGITRSALAFIATPIGAILAVIVGAIMAVKSAMKQSEDTTDRLKIAFSGLTGILSLVKKAIKAVGDFIIDKIIGAFEKLTNLGEKVAGTLKNIGVSALKFLGFKKAAESIEEYSKKVKEATENSKKLAQAQAQQTTDERNLKQMQDQHRKRAEELKQAVDDQTLSIKERIKANKEWGQVMKEQEQEELRIAKQAIEIAKMTIKQDGETAENRDLLAAATARVAEIENRMTTRRTKQLKQFHTLQNEDKKMKLDAYNRETEMMKQKMDLLIAQQGLRKKTLEEQLKLDEEIATRRKTLLDRDLKAEKITKEQHQLEILKINQELAGKRTEIAIQNAKDETEDVLGLLDKTLSERVRLFGDEKQILEQQMQARIDLLKKEYEAGVINAKEYAGQKNNIEETYQQKKTEIVKKYNEQQYNDAKTKQKLEHEAKLLALSQDLWTSFEKKQMILDQQRLEEEAKLQEQREKDLINEENYYQAKLNLEEKYKEASKNINREKSQAILNMAGDLFGNLATIAGKESKMGKAMAVAQTTITALQSATKAFNAMSGIPVVGPALGAAAAAAALASGMASVKQITAVKEPKTPTEVKTPAIKGYALGGIISGGMPVRRANGDNVMITAKLGEAILNRDQQKFVGAEVLSMAGIGSSTASDSNLSEIIAQAVYKGSMLGTSQGAKTGIIDLNHNKSIMELAIN